MQLGKALANDIGITTHGHEAGITVPSRDNMDVQMPGQSGAGTSAKIHSDVESVRLKNLKQQLSTVPYELH
jgi:hypothetical protein